MAAYEVPVKPLATALQLTVPLSFIAGVVDVVGFVALFGLFTSHFTGNFVIIGQEIVQHSLRLIAELIAIPIFLLVIGLCRLFSLRYEREGSSPLRTFLLIQAVLLATCMGIGIVASPISGPADPASILAAQFGVAAMAVQNAYGRLVLPCHPSTTVMTVNTSQTAIDFVDMYRGVPGLSEKARERFWHTAPVVLSFIFGVIVGAYGYLFLSFWCLAVPIAGLVALALLERHRRH